jgi:long-chain acyl-CoA synthetase
VNAPKTLNELFFNAVDRFSSKRAALQFKAEGGWHDISHHELARRVKHTALGLYELGVRPGDKVAILSHNRAEWAVADYACLTARCADVPIYPTLTASQVAYGMRDSGAVAAFVEDREQYDKVAETRPEVPALKHVIMFTESAEGPGVITHQQLMQNGAAAEATYPNYEQDARAVEPSDLATLIYTSGTTGDPKGVMLTHHNFVSNVLSALTMLPIGPDDTALSLLPLSHSFERMAGHYSMLHAGVTVAYAESIEKVQPNMVEVKPTVLLAVPRLYEKIYARVLENALSAGGAKAKIFAWAKKNGELWADRALAGERVPAWLGFKKKLADKLVFSKLKARTGGRIRFFVSGAAALPPEIAKFFYAAGLPIVEGYGLTETTPVITVNPLDQIRIGSVGRPIPGVEVKIAADGEILARGPNIMLGYYNKPEATAEAIDSDGWFHTGDIGELDPDGFLRITDRKKDIIVTAGGKNIAPQPIENTVKLNKFVENVVMIGDKRRFPIMLIVPTVDAVKGWATERSLPTDDYGSLLKHPDVIAKIEREVMLSLRDLASFETPKKFALIKDDFTIESGELTPTMKVKRRVVEANYQTLIEELYAD